MYLVKKISTTGTMRLFILFNLTFLLFVNAPYAQDDTYSSTSEIDKYYSQQISSKIWQMERRNQEDPSTELSIELLQLKIKNLEHKIPLSNDTEKHELIQLLSTLKTEYRKNLNSSIQALRISLQSNPENNLIKKKIQKLQNEIPSTHILCINTSISYSSGIFGHKEHDTFSCADLVITKNAFSMEKSGIFGSNAKISKITDTQITVFRWTNAFSDVKYTIKLWVSDIK